MRYKDAAKQIEQYQAEVRELRRKMQAARAAAEPEEVQDYEFASRDGKVRLSALFGGRDDLFVIHNMGKSCPHCTLWADGFNGIYHHLTDRAAFVVSTPDAPEVQNQFAASRSWRFAMVSHRGTTFAADMGYLSKSGGFLPGVSVFRRAGPRTLRVSDAGFQPLDDFCSLWHLFDLLPDGAKGWRAKFAYS